MAVMDSDHLYSVGGIFIAKNQLPKKGRAFSGANFGRRKHFATFCNLGHLVTRP